MSDDDEAGWGRPPIGSRFKPGKSGNPNGRPRGKRDKDPYDAVLGRMVTVREGGMERRMRADAAFLLHMAARGLAGESVFTRTALQALEADALHSPPQECRVIVYSIYPERGDLRDAIQQLGIATLLDGYRPSARLGLESWVIEEALARLGDRQLAADEQRIVLNAARMPNKVRWPSWWSVYEI